MKSYFKVPQINVFWDFPVRKNSGRVNIRSLCNNKRKKVLQFTVIQTSVCWSREGSIMIFFLP